MRPRPSTAQAPSDDPLATPLARLACAAGKGGAAGGADPDRAEQPGPRVGGHHLGLPDHRAGGADPGDGGVLGRGGVGREDWLDFGLMRWFGKRIGGSIPLQPII